MNGLPDDGNSSYMLAKGYSTWYLLSITRRLHRNDFEHLVTTIPMSLVNGMFYPKLTMGLLTAYFIGRRMFTNGYQEKEAASNQYRMFGSVTVNMIHAATIGVSFFLAMRLITGKLCL